MLDEFLARIAGTYNNFQQCWLQQTEEDLHRETTDHPHQHLEVTLQVDDDNRLSFSVREARGERDEILTERLRVSHDPGAAYLRTERPGGETYRWSPTAAGWEGLDQRSGNRLVLTADGLEIHQPTGLFVNPGAPYRLQRCRPFDGWIEVPRAAGSEEMHRFPRLRLHDQGGLVAGGGYTVELTQLVYAHRLRIMKLAVYDCAPGEVDFNRRAVSYAWAEPEARRLGLNLRYLSSGWTLAGAGIWNSDRG